MPTPLPILPDPVEPATPRLLLRRWRAQDLPPLAAMHRDPEVMRCLPGPLSSADSEAFARCCQQFLQHHGWGTWAVESRADGAFVGVVGLAPIPPGFEPADGVEMRWRLARRFWGRGLATEAARAALRVAFERLALHAVQAFTASCNLRSQAVMLRLGMRRVAEFDHPRLAVGHPLRRQVLYQLGADPAC